MGYRRSKHKKSGFTLVEILIVILIIGILLAVAAPVFQRARENSQARSCQNNLKQILGAKERWAMDNHRGPSDMPTMAELAGSTMYIKVAPVCQAGGTYTIGRLDKEPTCSVGGAPADRLSHVLQ